MKYADPIDRTHRVSSAEFAEANPERISVHRMRPLTSPARFGVWRGLAFLGAVHDFATAITYADLAAREGTTE